MSNQVRSLIVICCLVFFSGCAHVISKDLRNKVDPALTFGQVIQNPIACKGKTVVWGGEIIEILNQKNGTTEIEVFQIPLDSMTDAPKASNASEGRFLILVNKYLDPYLYQKGKRITVAGEILGEQIKPLGEVDYRYPLVSSQQIYLWEEYYYYPYPYHYPYYYYPWGYYDPWWGYPYWWGGFGLGYYGGYYWGYHGGNHDGGHHDGGNPGGGYPGGGSPGAGHPGGGNPGAGHPGGGNPGGGHGR
jgi:outer membrane lipoprotein